MGAPTARRARPQDVSLGGFDDMSFSGDLTPTLTTARGRYRELGRLAGRLLAEEEQSALKIILPVDLVIRNPRVSPPK
jgi:DNA-binding LacI/PurR family transcriptional regulator